MNGQPPVTWIPGALEPWDSPQGLQQHPMRRPGVTFGRPGGGAPFDPSGQRVITFDPWAFVKLNGDQTRPLTQANVSVQMLQQSDTPRNYLAIRNSSTSATTNLFIGFGSAATVNSVFRITQNTMIAWDTGVPQDDVYVLVDGPNGQVSWVVSTLSF